MELNQNNFTSSVVVSNDKFSKIIKVNESTKIEDFYQQIINQFELYNEANFSLKLFYYEGYSHKIIYIEKEQEYVIANKKGIEYFYLCSNSNNNINNGNINYSNYLKYHSVLVFSPIKILNSDFQNTQRKKMQINLNNQFNLKNKQ